MVDFTDDLSSLREEQAVGFHQDWAREVTSEELFSLWKGSEWTLFAMDGRWVVGYISVIGDGTLFAFISSLEVLPEYRGKGIGTELVRRTVERYKSRCALDLLCDEKLVSFYERFGMKKVSGMCLRNYEPRP